MNKKSFILIILVIIATFCSTFMIKYYRPASSGEVNFDNFPLKIGDWVGYPSEINQGVLDLLKPKDIFSATYVNSDGASVHLFFDFFSSDAVIGGPHSPRNCLPGSGWKIEETESGEIQFKDRTIPAGRFRLTREDSAAMAFSFSSSNNLACCMFCLYSFLSSIFDKTSE